MGMGNRIWSPSKKRVIWSRNGVFDEDTILRPIEKGREYSLTNKQVELEIQHEHQNVDDVGQIP